MATSPHILKNFSLFIDGEGLAGKVEQAEMPEIKIKTEEHRAGGMDGSIEVDMGMETLTAKLTLSEYVASIVKKFATQGTRFTLRGSSVRDLAGTRISDKVTFTGSIKTLTPGTWKAGDKATMELELTLSYYRWERGGEELFEIDVENMIRSIGGVDQLAGIRSDLGL